MLYYPWYDEQTDILGGYVSYAEHYDHIKAIVCKNEKKFTVEEFDNIRIDEDSRPEHAWCQIAPCTEDNNGQTAREGSELLTNILKQELADNAELM